MSCLKKSLDCVPCVSLCICVCLCWNLLILSLVGGWVTGPGRRSGRKESQYGILIRTGKEEMPASMLVWEVCLSDNVCSVQSSMRAPLTSWFWESHLGNVEKDKRWGGTEHGAHLSSKINLGKKWIHAHWKLLFQLYPIRLELRQTKSFNAIELPAVF